MPIVYVRGMSEARHEERERRLVKNEQAFRAYNERRRALEAETDEQVPFVCECGDSSCLQMVEVTPDEWEDAHHRDDQFVVVPGPEHVFPDIEQIVDRRQSYWVVRKFALPADAA